MGLMVNTKGFVGLLPIIAMVQITLSNYYLKAIKSIKTSFIINSGIYIGYFVAIYDFASVGIESLTVLIGIVSLIKLIQKSS